ncbi:hypothetical protein DYI81_15405 [Acinetobacter sp. SWAC5]|nr:hypothetical protein DYI81_15405 [Acinetobacter sp. SWAC5]
MKLLFLATKSVKVVSYFIVGRNKIRLLAVVMYHAKHVYIRYIFPP